MTTVLKKSPMSMEELSGVSGGSKNSDNLAVKTVIDAFNKVKSDHIELLRSSGCLGATDRFGQQ